MNRDEMVKLFADSFKNQESVIKGMVEKAMAPVKKKVDRLEKEVKAIDNKITEADDIASRVANIQLNGLPFREGEDLAVYFKHLASKLGYEPPPDVKLRRFNGTDDNKRPIMLTFSTEFHKCQFLQRFKAKSSDMVRAIFPDFPRDNSRLYAQHDFTATQYKLHKVTMSLLKEKVVYKVAVHSNNKIMIQFTADDKFTYFPDAETLKSEIDQRRSNKISTPKK